MASGAREVATADRAVITRVAVVVSILRLGMAQSVTVEGAFQKEP